MKEITFRTGLKKQSIILYSSIKDLPIQRYNEFQKLLLQDFGIGSDIEGIGQRFGKLYRYLADNNTKEAIQEARNLHNAFFYVVQGINIQSYCMASLVYSINGKKYDDLTDMGVQRILSALAKTGITQSKIEESIDEVKKNLIQNFNPSLLIQWDTAQELITLMNTRNAQN